MVSEMTDTRQRATRWLLILAILSALLIPFHETFLSPSTTKALCVTPSPDYSGTWNNITTTRSIVKATFTFQCGDVRYCDQYGNCTTPYTGFLLRLWGACTPTPCDWGTVKTYKRTIYHPTLYYPVDSYLEATYVQSFAKRTVEIRSRSSNEIGITVRTVFTDNSGRAPYTSYDILRR